MRQVFPLFCILLTLALPAKAQDQQALILTPEEMRVAAANAIVAGDPRSGYALSSALLQRDPGDIEARIIQARAARDLGRPKEAASEARLAWRGARTSSEKFGASMVMAQALSSQGARTRAQLWLRRAGQHAPNEQMKSIAVRDFRYVQRINPWATELSFSVAPSSNINNGSRSNRTTLRLFGQALEVQLLGSALALSGTEYSFGLATRYRLYEDARQQHTMVLRLNHRTYTMSAEAKRIAPTAKGSDFAFSSAALSYVRNGFSGAGTTLPNQLEVTLGRTIYGQNPFMQFQRVGVTQSFVTGPGRYNYVGLSLENQMSLSRRADVQIASLSVGTQYTLGNNDVASLHLIGRKSSSKDPSLDYRQITLRAEYAFAKPVLGVKFNMGLSLKRQSHDSDPLALTPREDNEITADITAQFTQIEFYGFSPTMTVSARRNNSNLGIYQAEDYGIQMGIRSSF